MLRRRHFFINKPFQAKFFIGFVLLLVLQAALIAMFFTHFAGKTLTTGYSGGQFTIDKTSRFFLVSFVGIVLVAGISIAIAGTVVFILLSHQIAGPLYRFEKSLEEIARGDLTGRIHLRKTDQLKKLQSALNTALDAVNGQIGGIKKDLEEAQNSPSHEETRRVIARIKQKTDFFKTS